MATESVTSTDGTCIAYDVTGNGPVLMLLDGAGKTRRDWHKVGSVDRLKRDFTVVTVDLRGTGESDFVTDIAGYAIGKLCDDLNVVADACAVERFLIWGYSFGGNIARYFGAWSDRAAAIAVIGLPFGPANVQVEIIDGLDHGQEFSDIGQVLPIVGSFFGRHISSSKARRCWDSACRGAARV